MWEKGIDFCLSSFNMIEKALRQGDGSHVAEIEMNFQLTEYLPSNFIIFLQTSKSHN
jgi:hypothetical protein